MDKIIKYEFHIHTRYSKDSLLNGYLLLLFCKIKGINGICITDHNTIKAKKYLPLFNRHGLKAIIGEEIMTTEGEMIGLFLTEEIPERMTPEMTVMEIKRQDGLVYIPHPFDERRTKTILNYEALMRIRNDIDIVEYYNGRGDSDSDLKQQEIIAKKLQKSNNRITVLVGSDAHICFELGKNYCIVKDYITQLSHQQSWRECLIYQAN